MTDRTPTYPGRVKLVPVTGQENTYDMERADVPVKEGTPLNKSTFLKDATAAKFGLTQADPTVDDALDALSLITGNGKPTTETPGAIGQMYYGGKNFGFFMCVAHVTNDSATSYVWASMNPSAAAFGTRGPIVFSESGTFKISDYGLSVGDSVNVICIGGGGGGAAGRCVDSTGASSTGETTDGTTTDGGTADSPAVEGETTDGATTNGTYETYYGDNGEAAGTNGGYGSGGDGGAMSFGYRRAGGGGGGSGFVASGTVVLNAEEIAVTIGAGGAGETKTADGDSTTPATDGGATSFGNLLTAEGGKKGTASVGQNTATSTGGDGGHPGGSGGTGTSGTQSGGSGGAGWNITGTFTYGTQSSPNIQGAGACFIWY